MPLIDLIFGASGGLFGTITHLATDYMDRKNKIALMEAQSKMVEQTEQWKAFTAAQTGASTSFAVPTTAAPWAQTLYTCIAALKESTRPLLTWAAVTILITVYLKSTLEVRASITPELNFCCWTAIMFWFGSRYTRK